MRSGKARAAAVAAIALAGCGGAAPPRARRARSEVRPALCGSLRAHVTGRIADPAATELSGLVLSRSRPGVLWTHNDSGDRARLLAVTPAGRLLADVAVTGAANVDWEDLAIGPARGGGDALYIADIGDNLAARPQVTVYRVREPRAGARSAPAERLALRYPDGAHDAEALLVDPTDGALVVVTKSFAGTAGVYVARRAQPGATTLLRGDGRLAVGGGDAVTAGDVSADGRTVVVRTYARALVWTRRPREPLAAVLRRRPCVARADLLAEGQGEALALTADGRAFYTVPEGRRPAIRRYAAAGRVRARRTGL